MYFAQATFVGENGSVFDLECTLTGYVIHRVYFENKDKFLLLSKIEDVLFLHLEENDGGNIVFVRSSCCLKEWFKKHDFVSAGLNFMIKYVKAVMYYETYNCVRDSKF